MTDRHGETTERTHRCGAISTSLVGETVRLAGSPVLIAIPLFTFAGYLFAESGTPRRLVR